MLEKRQITYDKQYFYANYFCENVTNVKFVRFQTH